jgi:hypothetical protein
MARPRLPVVLVTAAVGWSLALMAAMIWAPLYSADSSSCDSAGHCSSSSGGATMVQVNGARSVLAISVFLIACAVLAWVGLHFRCARGSRTGTIVAWAAVVLVLGFSAISFGFGLFTLPMAAMMAFAAARTPAGRLRSN